MSKSMTITGLGIAALMGVAGTANAGISFGLSLNLRVSDWCAPHYAYAPVYYAPVYSCAPAYYPVYDSCETARYWRYDPYLCSWRWFDYDPDCATYAPTYSYYPSYSYYPAYSSGYIWNGPYYYPSTWGIGFSSGNFFFGLGSGWGWNSYWGCNNRWDRWDRCDDQWDHHNDHDWGHHDGGHHDWDHHGGGGGAHLQQNSADPVMHDHPFAPGGHTQPAYYNVDGSPSSNGSNVNSNGSGHNHHQNQNNDPSTPQAFGHGDLNQVHAKPLAAIESAAPAAAGANFADRRFDTKKPVIADAKPASPLVNPQFTRDNGRAARNSKPAQLADSKPSSFSPVMAQPIESKPIAPVAAKPIESKPIEQFRPRNTPSLASSKPAPAAIKPAARAEEVYVAKAPVQDISERSAPSWAGRQALSDKPAKAPDAKPAMQPPTRQRAAAPSAEQFKPAEQPQPREYKAPAPQMRNFAPVRMEAPQPQPKPARAEAPAPRREAPVMRQSAPAPKPQPQSAPLDNGSQMGGGSRGRHGR